MRSTKIKKKNAVLVYGHVYIIWSYQEAKIKSPIFFILACDCPFNGLLVMKRILNDQFRVSIGEQIKNKNRSHFKKHFFIMNTGTDE